MKLDLQPLDLQPVEDTLDLQPLDLQALDENDTLDSNIQKGANKIMDAAQGAGETALSFITGLPAQIGAGWAGLAKAHEGPAAAAKATEDFAHKYTYEPRDDTGKSMVEGIGNIFAMPGKAAGAGAEALGLEPIWGQLPTDVAMAFAPIGFGSKLSKSKGRASKKPDPIPNPNLDAIMAEEKALQKPNTPQGRVDINLDEGPNLPKQIDVNKEGQGNVMPNDPGLELAIAKYKEQTARSDAELQFWRDRAAQMETEAANIERRKGLRPMHVNEEGTAGRPGELEGLRQSTEGITYENVPPDGVIPRNAPTKGLEVPKGNEWVKDENGMPVRQGLPEQTIEEPPMNLSPDTPQANEMGLAIQEANGPKLGADQTYGNGPIKSPGGRQGGWINPEILDPAYQKFKELSGLGAKFKDMFLKFKGDPTTPSVQAFKRTVNDYGRPIDEPMGHVYLQGPLFEDLGHESRMEAQFIRTHEGGKGIGLPEEMYKFINELGNEMYPARVQTTGGQKMWDRFHRNGMVEKDGAFKRAVDLYIGDLENRMPSTFFGAAQGAGANHVPQPMRIPNRQRGALILFDDKVPEGMVRLYHGGNPKEVQGSLWFTSDKKDAFGWANRDKSMGVWYVDVPKDSAFLGGDPNFGVLPNQRVEVPAEFANNRKVYPLYQKDTVTEPRSPATIEKKQELAVKATALKLENTPYGLVTTKEQAIAQLKPEKLGYNPVRDAVSSGIAGMVYRNPDNSLLKFGRYVASKARETSTKFSTEFVTGQNGVVKTARALDDYESVRVASFLVKVDAERIQVTDRLIAKYGFNDKEIAAVKAARKGLDEMYSMGNAALGKQGLENFAYRAGYLPSNFSGAYKTLIIDVNELGEKKVKFVISEDTKGKHNMALEHYKQNIGKSTDLIVSEERRGLSTRAKGQNNSFNGFLDLIDTMAQHDPAFAAMKAEVDAHVAHNSHKLWEFNVHEKLKRGVGGAEGRKPWNTPLENAKETFEMLANHLEEGSRYFAYQDALNRIGEVTSDPALRNSHPNSVKYLEKYSAHITGGNLNNAGAAMNSVIDFVPKLMGVGPGVSSKAVKEATAFSTAHMMGFWNATFLGTQLTQFITGGFPEAARLRQATGLNGTEIGASFYNMNVHAALLAVEQRTGKKLESVQPHMREAYKYAHEQGMTQFSEGHLAKEINENQTYTKVKDAAMLPITVGEKMTRMPIFLWNVDTLHRAGLRGEELHMVARDATDYAMGNYHPDERPMIYQSLGSIGQLMGSLSTYKHNFLEQTYTTVQHAGKQPAAAAAVLGSMYMFYGISNLPGSDIADKAVQELTGHDTRYYLSKVVQDKALLDGYLSATTELDFASRLSTRNILPNDATTALAGSHVSNLLNITSKAITYAMDRNRQNRDEALLAATPAGMRGMTEGQVRKGDDGHVLDKEGRNKYDEPRSDRDWKLRQYLGAPRPLKEAVEDQELRSLDLGHKKSEDKIKKAVSQMKAALNLDDMEGFEKARQKFQDLGGNGEMLTDLWFGDNAVSSKISGRQRREGINPSGADQIRKYLDYNQ